MGMNARDFYTSRLAIAGALCLVLGVSNWTIGAMEASKYQSLLSKTAQTGLEESYRSFQELDQQKNEEVLRRINEDGERYNAARVKLNFFRVVLSGGRALFLFGLLLTLWSVIRIIRSDARAKIARLGGAEQPERT
jgi:hypothetical protein